MQEPTTTTSGNVAMTIDLLHTHTRDWRVDGCVCTCPRPLKAENKISAGGTPIAQQKLANGGPRVPFSQSHCKNTWSVSSFCSG